MWHWPVSYDLPIWEYLRSWALLVIIKHWHWHMGTVVYHGHTMTIQHCVSHCPVSYGVPIWEYLSSWALLVIIRHLHIHVGTAVYGHTNTGCDTSRHLITCQSACLGYWILGITVFMASWYLKSANLHY